MEKPCIPGTKYDKVMKCCSVARAAGYEYVWVDTCCIDKTSSVELSEAINSMYRWYQQAKICYAYLADVPSDCPAGRIGPGLSSKCKWFTRGWMLQELIASSEIEFLDENWQKIGTKSSLQQDISNITGIPVPILSGDEEVETASIAQRMSWAANRKTSRLEDRAYCLLGIFGINMPLLYGEGEKAFVRLQEEIMKVSDDHSLFAWKSKDQSHGGLLATSPDAFEESADIIGHNPSSVTNSPSTFSNKGIHLEIPFVAIGYGGIGLAILRCMRRGKDDVSIAIYLRDISIFLPLQRFQRVWSETFELFNLSHFRPSAYPVRQICVRRPRLGKKHGLAGTIGHEFALGGLRNSDGELLELIMENLVDDMVVPLSTLLSSYGERKDEERGTPLSYAAAEGHDEVVWLLMTRHDVDVHSKDKVGLTPLSHAARKPHEAVVKMLLGRGDVQHHFRDGQGRTPLSHASERGHEAVVKMFLARGDIELDKGDQMDRTPLTYAAEEGHEAIVKLLLEKGADIEAKDYQDWYRRTPLWCAAKRGYEAVVKLLLEKGADIEAKDFYPTSHPVAVGSDKTDMDLQLAVNAAPKREGFRDKTPLHCAAEEGHEATVKLLLEKGADIEAKDHDHQAPLHCAAEAGHTAIVKLLLEKGADIEAEDHYHQAPLHCAAEAGHEAIVKLLLEKGADIEAKKSCLHCMVGRRLVTPLKRGMKRL
jgi:ankyrin repeat protein